MNNGDDQREWLNYDQREYRGTQHTAVSSVPGFPHQAATESACVAELLAVVEFTAGLLQQRCKHASDLHAILLFSAQRRFVRCRVGVVPQLVIAAL